jgi:hypothetical protein
MTTKAPTPKPQRGKLKITQQRVVDIIVRIINTEGLEAAQEQFKLLNNLFSTERGWSETAAEIYAIFAEEQKRLRIEQLEAELAKQRAGAASFIMMNQNEASGMKDSRMQFYAEQFNGLVEKGAEINHTKYGDPKE